MQQPPGLLPAPVVVQRPSGADPPGGGELQVAVDAMGDRPADEVTGFGFAGTSVPASQVSRSAWEQLARVSPRSRGQLTKPTAARARCRTVSSWP